MAVFDREYIWNLSEEKNGIDKTDGIYFGFLVLFFSESLNIIRIDFISYLCPVRGFVKRLLNLI